MEMEMVMVMVMGNVGADGDCEMYLDEIVSLIAEGLYSDELGLVLSAKEEHYRDEANTIMEDTDDVDDGTASASGMEMEEPPFLLREHSLGVAFWCIPILLQYAVSRFREIMETVAGT